MARQRITQERYNELARHEWLTIHEAAELLGCTRQTVRNWLDAGRLPPSVKENRGRSIRFRTARLQAWAISNPH